MLSRVVSAASRGVSFFISIASIPDTPTADTEVTPDTEVTASIGTPPSSPFDLNLRVVSTVMVQFPELRDHLGSERYIWIACHIAAVATAYARLSTSIPGGFNKAKNLGNTIALLAIGKPGDKNALRHDLAMKPGTLRAARRVLSDEPRALIEAVNMTDGKLAAEGWTLDNLPFLIMTHITDERALKVMVALRLLEAVKEVTPAGGVASSYGVTAVFAAFIIDQLPRPNVAPLSIAGDDGDRGNGNGGGDDSGGDEARGNERGADIGGRTPRDDLILERLAELEARSQERIAELEARSQERHKELLVALAAALDALEDRRRTCSHTT